YECFRILKKYHLSYDQLCKLKEKNIILTSKNKYVKPELAYFPDIIEKGDYNVQKLLSNSNINFVSDNYFSELDDKEKNLMEMFLTKLGVKHQIGIQNIASYLNKENSIELFRYIVYIYNVSYNSQKEKIENEI